MNIVLFEDAHVLNLSPITLSRPAFAISCGGICLAELAIASGHQVYGATRPYVAHISELDLGLQRISELPSHEPVLCVNARAVPTQALSRLIESFDSADHEATAKLVGDQVALAFCRQPIDHPDLFQDGGSPSVVGIEKTRSFNPLRTDVPLFDYPHDVICWHVEQFQESLNWRLNLNRYVEFRDGVYLGDDVKLNEPIVFDTSGGPILIEQGTEIGPFTVLHGPLHVGPEVTIAEHSSMRGGVAVGRSSKIGGEIQTTTIEAYSNKRHHGYLGHSYLGSWVNLGAGTSNSDLKNTYGEIRMTYAHEKVATGTQFLGCIIGDHVKTAINTSIFTGKLVGPCSMLYGVVANNVPSFVNYFQSMGQVTEIPATVAATTQRRAFERRNIEQRDADIHMIETIFELTQLERQSAAVPVVQGLPSF